MENNVLYLALCFLKIDFVFFIRCKNGLQPVFKALLHSNKRRIECGKRRFG